jgi:hypothetical protein
MRDARQRAWVAAAARSPAAYTPKHLPERIISSKAALEGEREQAFGVPMLSCGTRLHQKSRGIRLMGAFLGDGLLTAEGDLWLRQRRQPASHRERVAAHAETLVALEGR